ncbi:MAG: hypothetical protein ACK4NC_07380 [Candidatus Gracilibacteria bacterium]
MTKLNNIKLGKFALSEIADTKFDIASLYERFSNSNTTSVQANDNVSAVPDTPDTKADNQVEIRQISGMFGAKNKKAS